MIRCKECGSAQFEGALFCSECGSDLLKDGQTTTAVLPFSDRLAPPTPSSLSANDLTPVTQPQTFTFVIPSSGRRIAVTSASQILVGRNDPIRGVNPQLDLTPDGGGKHGVSRLHATIQITAKGPVLIDYESTNGTMLNNYRLPAEMPYLLHTGDEIRFGHLLVHIFFE
jgi:hypothetical protein